MKEVVNLLLELQQEGIAVFLEDSKLRYRTANGQPLEKEKLLRISNNKAGIISFLEKEEQFNKRNTTPDSIELLPRPAKLPLAYAQERLWFIDKFQGSSNYHIPTRLRIKGHLDIDSLEQAFRHIVSRHEVLRTCFKEEEGVPFQEVTESNVWNLKYRQVHQLQQHELEAIIRKEIVEPFDLASDFMLRASLFELNTCEYLLIIVMHHIASDGWSTPVLINELAELYKSIREHRQPNLPVLPIQFIDFAIWQRNHMQGEWLENELQYWEQRLKNTTPIYLPTDFPRPAVQSTRGKSVQFVINKELSAYIREFSQREGVTFFVTLLAMFKVLVYRYTGQGDICVGCPVSTRRQSAIQSLIGFFVNVLSIRSELNGSMSFRELITQVKESTLEAYNHQELSFEKIVERIEKKRDVSRSPVFQVMFVFQNYDQVGSVEIDGLDLAHELPEAEFCRVDLSFTVTETPDFFNVMVTYCRDLFLDDTIKTMIDHYLALLSEVAKDAAVAVGKLNMLSLPEKTRLLSEYNNTAVPYPREKTLVRLFEEQVERTPNAVAVVFGTVKLTYRKLNEKANLLAGYLRKTYSIVTDDRVGIRLERGESMIIAILGILKSGAAYVPIDPTYPAERITYMIQDSECKAVVDDDMLFTLNVERFRYSNRNPAPVNTPEDLAYIIYTSGSTGLPKGVGIRHRSVINEISCHTVNFGVTTSDRILQTANYVFDTSVEQIFLSLLNGATLVCIAKEVLSDNTLLEEIITKEKITHLHLAPRILQNVSAGAYPNLKRVLSGGETVPLELARAWSPFVDFYNKFGPTETTINSTAYLYRKEDDSKYAAGLPIGKPLWNTRIYILDGENNLVPRGVAGELYIGGDGLAKGYIGRDELTKERFIAAPFNNAERIYKTGDIVRWLPDGNIEFIGRKDEQVKIRGYRVEPGEIEALLMQLQFVKQCAVLAKEDGMGDKQLVAYIVSQEEYTFEAIREFLATRLPAYMIPSVVISVPSIPLTVSGKTDKKYLLSLDVSGSIVSGTYMAPRNETEKKLAAIWTEVLDREQISVKDNFFEIGGHSLRATRLASQVYKSFGVKLELKQLFMFPVLEEQAQLIDDSLQTSYITIQKAAEKEYYALSSAQKRLYFLQNLAPHSTSYNITRVQFMGAHVDKEKIFFALQQLVQRHQSLRTAFETVGGEPHQKIYDEVPVELNSHTCSISDFETYLNSFIRPFDLSTVPLLRSSIVHIHDVGYIWIIDMHHIISDGTSHQVMTDDFIRLYRGEELPPLRLQYRDFSEWQNRVMESGELELQKQYWLKLFSDGIPKLNFPSDRLRPAAFTFEGAKYEFTLDAELTALLRRFSAKYQSTLQMNLLSVLNILLYKYTGQEDMVVGCGIAGRRHPDVERIVGMFVNTLVTRNFPAGNKTFEAFHREVISSCINAYDNQDIQFDDLVDMLKAERDPSRNPVFDVCLVVQNFEQSKLYKKGIEEFAGQNEPASAELSEAISRTNYQTNTSKFDMTWRVFEREDVIEMHLEYYSAIYDAATIERCADHFRRILKVVMETPGIGIDDIDIITPVEEATLLSDFTTGPQSHWINETTIHDAFTQQSRLTPEAIAVCDEKGSVSYASLDAGSNQLGHFLCDQLSINKGSKVGILQSRSKELLLSVLGTLKAGGAYVPLDSDYPEQRLVMMIEEAGIEVLLTEKDFIELANRLQWRSSTLKHLVCVNSENIYAETGALRNALMQKELWDHVGEVAPDAIAAGGWKSSYTGEYLSKDDMEEYSESAFLKLKPYLHREMKVLEIGCSSGLTMFKVAPYVNRYYGTDLSSSILKGAEREAEDKGYSNIVLSCMAAHEIDQLEEKDFDLVIINSVIQCFDGHNYLRNVLVKAMAKMKDTGLIFLGDLMDEDKRDDLIKDLAAFKEANAGKGYHTKTDWPDELFISRQYINDLVADNIGIVSVAYSDKIYSIRNELSLYRFDALLEVNKARVEKDLIKSKYQHDLRAIRFCSDAAVNRGIAGNDLAYIMYTSGSTGTPKGVMIEHKSVLRLVRSNSFIDFTRYDKCLSTGSISFDATTIEFWGMLLNGGKLVLCSQQSLLDPLKMTRIIREQKINVMWFTAGWFNQLVDSNVELFDGLEAVLVGGDKLSLPHIRMLRQAFPSLAIINGYGPTENTTFSTCYEFPYETGQIGSTPIGKPIGNSSVYILNNRHKLQPVGWIGEICVGGHGLARGYVNHADLTEKKFIVHPYKANEKIYRTGDLGRWLPDGNVEFMGRKDEQVKIRGFRVEPGEIEALLMQLPFVKQGVVLAKEDGTGDKQLVAYIVSQEEFMVETIREYLATRLPAYMIPSAVISVPSIPLTVTGKTDKKYLLSLDVSGSVVSGTFIAPRNETEKKLAAIWTEIVDRKQISVKDNFFEIGGHSLRATRLASEVYKGFGVKLELKQVFMFPVLEEQAQLIDDSLATSYITIEKAAEKEYYALSSAQKRLYFLYEFDKKSTGYNMPMVHFLGKTVNKEKLESALKALIQRHESLRTSFNVVNDRVYQKIHEQVMFSIEEYACTQAEFQDYLNSFIRPFDLSRASLMRSSLVNVEGAGYCWILDMHHIISDGVSLQVMTDDFIRLYRGEELPPMHLQYRDFSEWQNRVMESGELEQQKQYWLGLFSDGIPKLNFPSDRPRPAVFTFEGAKNVFVLDAELTALLRRFSAKYQSTFQMNLLSVLNVLLYKYTGQEDIVVGCGIAGRRHPDVEHIVGMFVNTLVTRNFPMGNKTFEEFHREVSASCINAYDNQDIQFDELVDMLKAERDPSRNPVFDVCLVVQNFEQSKLGKGGMEQHAGQNEPLEAGLSDAISRMNYRTRTSKFDMTWRVYERENDIEMHLEYYSAIYNPAAMQRLINNFIRLLKAVLTAPGMLISDISIPVDQEEQSLLMLYGSGPHSDWPYNHTIHGVFEQQCIRTPDAIAIADEKNTITYRALNERSSQLGRFLADTLALKRESMVGILQSRSLEFLLSVLGVLKAGGAYVPLDSAYPEQRLLFMLEDAGVEVLLVEKDLIELANRLQWRSKTLKHLVCIDSHDIYGEKGVFRNALMRKELWEHVGDKAGDAIAAGGWQSSYTGEDLSKDDMEEYSESAFLKLKPYLHREMKVLEIGCSSGLTMFKVAPYVNRYYGTDLSSSILKGTQREAEARGFNNIVLSCMAAHEIDQLEEKDFDMVIINSVIQCFDGHNYLRNVLIKAIAKMKDTGLIFLGDLMDEDKRDDLIKDLAAFKEANRGKGYRTKTDWSAELFLSRRYIEDLVAAGIGIISAAYSDKIYSIKNELSLYRFDALLKTNKRESAENHIRKKYQHDLRQIDACSTASVNVPVTSNNLAYVMYTSGSTGTPKGVMVEHKSVLRLVRFNSFIDFGVYNKCLSTGSVSFDATTIEFWGMLLNGGKLVLCSQQSLLDPLILARIISEQHINVMWFTSGWFNQLVSSSVSVFGNLKAVMVGGDKLSLHHIIMLKQQYPHITIINGYGPTENTTFSACYEFPADINAINGTPIGKPVGNSSMYILNESAQLQPVGWVGEICVGGGGLARGYLNNPVLTAEKFVDHPFKNEKIYRTGDLGRISADGNIEFIGRKDEQVKIRGFRVEPGEIEKEIQRYQDVESAIVLARTNQAEKELVAYIVSRGPVNVVDLRSYLNGILPAYMVPAHFVELKTLPLTANGKIDKRKLPDPVMGSVETAAGYIAPRNEMEAKMANIWQKILGVDKVGITDKFLDLGGHSLLAVRIGLAIRNELDLNISMSTFFQYDTIASLSDYIQVMKPVEEPGATEFDLLTL
jgi:amino acid adenylation domain-containing protein